jgi:putative FmdB family regulatory protein
MPLYEYECTACHRRTEKIQKFSDTEITVCPHCSGLLERVLSAPAIAFKGGGWYADGYGNAKPKSNSTGDSASTTASSSDAKSSSSDSKSSGSDSKSSSSDSKSSNGASTSTGSAPAAAPAAAPATASSSSDKK